MRANSFSDGEDVTRRRSATKRFKPTTSKPSTGFDVTMKAAESAAFRGASQYARIVNLIRKQSVCSARVHNK